MVPLKSVLKFFVVHPVLGGLSIESVLVLLFWIFPAGSCNTPVVGVAIIYAHYPALLFLERILGVPYSSVQFFASVGLMTVLWVGMLFLTRYLFASHLK